ncbi:hypothetical protein OS493_038580 [Desmophyllum pertusum]|uniref:alkaline phosphatase n=1 Tax=Desmophyllum pertusum TaxID=174260 RepID=A0A9X0CIV1_9CNID|nr:hypothetical protein OS493_038580 [Desmophyllum pertusum]
MIYFSLVLFVVEAVSGNILTNQDNNQWYKDGVKLIQDNLKVKPNMNTAKSAIIFVGDGMGITTVTAARILDGQMKGQTGEENVLSWEVFPWSAQVKTYAVDQQGADSAASATAFLNGIKTNDGVLGMDETVKRGYCSSASADSKAISILSLAEMAGMSTGIVTTTRVTHATPASAYAFSADRGWESDADKEDEARDDASACKDIALQLVEYPHGDGIEVIFGGGRRELMHRNQRDPEYPKEKGKRLDGRDLIQEWVEKHPNSQYVWNQTGFDQIDVKKVDHVIGLFEDSHMQYEVNRADDSAGEPSIAEMTEKAIQILQKNPKGYFLLVEGGRIDHGHHGGRAIRALQDTLAMDKAVSKAITMINPDETLITVTADHSHVFTIGAYPKRGNPIFDTVRYADGRLAVGSDNKTYTSLGYANGRGGLRGPRPDLRGVDTTHKNYRQQATVRLRSETHGTEDVGVYADGPGAYLFHGVFEQQYVFHVLDHALCLSNSKQKSCDKHVKRRGKPRNRAYRLWPLFWRIPRSRRARYRRTQCQNLIPVEGRAADIKGTPTVMLMQAPDSLFLTANRTQGHGTCLRDSGGPVVREQDGKWYLEGVHSSGRTTCAY